MNVTKKALSAIAITASAAVGLIAISDHSVNAQDPTPRTNTAKPGEIWTTQPQSRIVPETRSTALRTAMQRLTANEQRTFTSAINRLSSEERRVLAKAIVTGPALSGSTDLTPPTPPVPPTSPLNPATSSRTGQGASGSGTLSP